MEVNRANADLDERYHSVDPLNKSREDCGFGRSLDHLLSRRATTLRIDTRERSVSHRSSSRTKRRL